MAKKSRPAVGSMYEWKTPRGVTRRIELNNPFQGSKKNKYSYASYQSRKGPRVEKELFQDISGDNQLRVQKRKVSTGKRRRVQKSVDRDRNVSTRVGGLVSRATAPRHRTKRVFVNGELKKVVKKGRGVKRSVKRY